MGACVVVGRPTKVQLGNKNAVYGFLHLSASYNAGVGDTLDPLALGLGTIEFLQLGAPNDATGVAVTAIIYPVVRSLMPQRTATFGGSGGLLIQSFNAVGTETSAGDLSGYIIPFFAIGT